jgi:hypothetical protein
MAATLHVIAAVTTRKSRNASIRTGIETALNSALRHAPGNRQLPSGENSVI